MLTDPKLSLFTGMEEDINEADERPQHKITCFRYTLFYVGFMTLISHCDCAMCLMVMT